MAEIEEIFAAARRKLEDSQPAELRTEMVQALVGDRYSELTQQSMEHMHAVLTLNAYSSRTQRDDAVSGCKRDVCPDLVTLQADDFYSLQQQTDRILLSRSFTDITVAILGKHKNGTQRDVRQPNVDKTSKG